MHIVLSGINPEPWTAPLAAAGRKGGRVYATVSKSASLKAYQQAVRECAMDALNELDDDIEPIHDDNVSLRFWLWRQLLPSGVGSHRADATNMQKALEDALQGIIFENDRQVVDIQTVIVAQREDVEPLIVIEWGLAGGAFLPQYILDATVRVS